MANVAQTINCIHSSFFRSQTSASRDLSRQFRFSSPTGLSQVSTILDVFRNFGSTENSLNSPIFDPSIVGMTRSPLMRRFDWPAPVVRTTYFALGSWLPPAPARSEEHKSEPQDRHYL